MKNTFLLLIALLFTTLLISSSCNDVSKSKEGDNKVLPFDVTSMDTSVKPWEDFDAYANGKWEKNNPIPSTENSWGSFNILDKETREVKLKGIIKELLTVADHKKGTEAELITGYYRSYLDTVTIDKRGISPIIPLSDKISSVKNTDELIALAGELAKLSISGPFDAGVGADDRNSTMNAVFMGQSGLSLRDRNY